MFLLLFLVHNYRNEEIYITKSDFFYNFFFICNPKLCINQAIKVTKNDFGLFLFFLFLNVFTLIFSSQFVRNEVRNEEIYITKSDFFYKFFFHL